MFMQKLIFFISFAFFLAGCANAELAQNKQIAPFSQNEECVNGSTREGFASSLTYGDTPCLQGTQVCNSGKWQGPPLYPVCDNFTKSCDGVMHGTTVHGFLQPTASAGTACIPSAKTCIDGRWQGPEIYPTCTQL